MNVDLDLLQAIFARFELIDAVYLFGSRAQGKERLESDYDFAIVSSCDKKSQLQQLRDEVLGELTRAGFDHLSVVTIDFSDLYLAFEAVRNNALVYKKEGFQSADYYSLVVRRYLDFEPYLARQRRAFKERILHDGC